MADAEAEAAFLDSMRVGNNTDGNYELDGSINGQKAESFSTEEYEPAQAVPDTSFLPDSRELTEQISSPLEMKHALLPSTFVAQQINVTKSSTPISGQDQPESFPAALTESRSMSTTSLPSATVNSLPGTPQNPAETMGDIAHQPATSTYLSSNGILHHTELNDALPSVSSSVAKHAFTLGAMPLQIAASDHYASEIARNSAAGSATNLTVTTTDSSNAVLDDSTALTLQDPTAPEAGQTGDPVVEQIQTPSTAIPKARLPHDRIGILEDRIKEDPRGDLDAWLSLIGEHRKRGKLLDARNAYERFLKVFPTAAEQWVAYAQMENEAQNREHMETIFHRTLLQIPNLQLWSMYLDHIRRHNNTTTDTSGTARQIIHQAYDLALQKIGIDKDSGKVWQDYVQFIRSGPGNIGGINWQDQQKMDLLRKIYQRAICVPTQATNALWKEYDAFEMGLNKTTGRKFLQDQSPGYMTARGSYTEIQNISRELRRTTLPILPPALGFDGDVEYMKQLDIWKQWIQWEKDDPLVLKQEDVSAYRDRVVFVYKQALMAMRFWPELWFDAADFCFLNDLETQGNEFLEQGIIANPESCLLAFKQADRFELTSANEEGDESARRRGAAVREPYDKVLDALYDMITKAKSRETQELARIESQFASSSNGLADIKRSDDDEDVDSDEADNKAKSKAAQIETIQNVCSMQIRLLSKTISYTWIALMRAMRRIQGKGKVNDTLGGSRQIFTDARKRGRVTSDVYVASAMIEFHCYEREATKKIFERGIKLFPEDEGFALEYIKHLIGENDHTNARVVFETCVSKLAQKPETTPRARPLYAFFHDFESRYGELTQIVKLEKRMSDLFPEDPKLVLFSRRFAHHGFDPTAVRPMISPAVQARPKTVPKIQSPNVAQQSPPNRFVQQTDSPKRPLQVDELDNDVGRPRKVARGESPLKGAAGRRLDQQKRNQQPNQTPQFQNHTLPQAPPLPPPPTIPREVLFLLSIIPKAETYHATRFKAEEIVRLLRNLDIPKTVPQVQQPLGGIGLPQMPQMTRYPAIQQMPQAQMPMGHMNGGYPSSPFPLNPLNCSTSFTNRESSLPKDTKAQKNRKGQSKGGRRRRSKRVAALAL